MAHVNVAITRGSIDGTFATELPSHDPLEAVVLLVAQGQRANVLIALDVCFLSFSLALALRQTIARATGIAVENIITQCTHSHTAPWSQSYRQDGIDALAARLVALVEKARGDARPASMAFVEIDTGRKYNINRRKKLPGDLGGLCVHMGARDHHGDADFTAVNAARLEFILGRAPTADEMPRPMLYDGEVDGDLQAIYFRDRDTGHPIGSVARFAAHPAAAGHTTARMLSSDFPGVVRRHLEATFGGTCCFLNGPCGNLLTWEKGQWPEVRCDPSRTKTGDYSTPWLAQIDPAACWAEIERLGLALANELTAALPTNGDFMPVREMAQSLGHESLPLRDDLVSDPARARGQAEALAAKFIEYQREKPPAELKQLADRIVFLSLLEGMYSWYDITPQVLSQGELKVDLPIMRLDNVLLMGFPGETFWQTPQLARQGAVAAGLKFMSYTQANGDIGYIPADSERDLGDYEVNCSLIPQGAEARLAAGAAERVNAMV